MNETDTLPRLPSWTRILTIVIGFFAVCFLVYGTSLGNRFVAWDDNYVISFNPVVRGFTWDHLVKTFTTFVDPELYNPLTFISYQFDYTLGGLSPFIFHLDNLILHIISALLVSWLLYLLSKKSWIAIVGGLLFAVHPLNVEAVAWASARKDTLSTVFFFASIIAYVYHRYGDRKKLFYALSLVAFLCGLMSKVMVLTLPFVLILIDIYQQRTWSWNMILEKIPYVALSAIFGVVAIVGKQTAVSQTSLVDTVLMGCKSTVFYLQKLVWPTELVVIYPYINPVSIQSPDFYIPAIIVAVLIVIALACWKKSRVVTFGIAFYLLTLIPTFLNFSKGGEFYFASDRYAYVPQVGLILLTLTLIDRFIIQRKRNKHVMTMTYAASGIIIAILGVLAYAQSLTWKNSETLFVQTLKHYPDAVAARINLGLIYRESGYPEKAMPLFEEALKLRPYNALVVTNIGATLDKQGKTEEAIAQYMKAMRLEPKQPDAYFALGMVYERQGSLDQAFALYEKVREMSPKYVGVYNNLGSVYVQRNNFEKAAEMYRTAIDIDPFYADAHFNLAYVSEKLGQPEIAAQEYETTLELEGEKLEILQTLTGIYASQNKTAETVRTVKRMLAVDPTNAFATQFYDALKQSGLAQ